MALARGLIIGRRPKQPNGSEIAEVPQSKQDHGGDEPMPGRPFASPDGAGIPGGPEQHGSGHDEGKRRTGPPPTRKSRRDECERGGESQFRIPGTKKRIRVG